MFLQLLHLVENIFIKIVKLPWAVIEFVRTWLHFRALANRFPGPPALPLVGNCLDRRFFSNPMTLIMWVLEDVMNTYPVGQVFLGPVRTIILSEVNDIQTFLMNSENHSKPKVVSGALAYAVGRGLVTVNGADWKLHHKILKPTFHQNVLKAYLPIFNRSADEFIKLLAEHANGSAFDVRLMTQNLQTVTVCETLYGLPSLKQTNPDQDFFEMVLEWQRLLSQRLSTPWFYPDAIYNLFPSGRKAKAILKHSRNLLNEVVKQREEILRAKTYRVLDECSGLHNGTQDTLTEAPTYEAHEESNNKKFNILIDALLQENGKSISHESVLDELMIFFLAGYETTAITMQFAFYFLAKNPLVQEKAVRELRDIFDAAGSTEVTSDAVQRMQYVEMIVMETLRMHPPIFFFINEAGVDTPLVSCDLVVPAGAIVSISPRNVHMNPKLYPDPHVFDPERFSPENCAKRHPFAFIPFSAGKRSCIGRKYAMLVLKTVISKVIWNFHLQPDETYEPQLLWGISTVTCNGMRVKFLKRSEY